MNPRNVPYSDYKHVFIEAMRYLKKGFFTFFGLAAINATITLGLAKYTNIYICIPLMIIIAVYIDSAYTEICLNLRKGRSIGVLSALTENIYGCVKICMMSLFFFLAFLVIVVAITGIVFFIIKMFGIHLPVSEKTELSELASLMSDSNFLMTEQISYLTMFPMTTFLPQLCVFSGIELTRSTIFSVANKSGEGVWKNYSYIILVLIVITLCEFLKGFVYVNLMVVFTIPLIHSLFKFAMFKAIYLGDMETVFEKKVAAVHSLNGC